ncbi:MAG: RusA family crossover junction endodeoxyribonuclease [Terracidiphilus sp.]|jgi:Holliday junction resolvase RusA-like endonuclease
MDFEPTGLISFVIALPPTSQQSKRATKDAFTGACRQAMEAFPITLHGEVKIHIEWSIHEQDRYETDAAPDVDNIIKPLLDGLQGPEALLVDDCQVQEVACSWIDSPIRDQSVSITIRHRPDDWFRRGKLRFAEFSKCLCMPLAEDASKEAQLLLLEAWEMMFKTRDALLALGWDWYSAQGVMSIVRPFHKSRVVKKFAVVPVDELKREIKERIESARE